MTEEQFSQLLQDIGEIKRIVKDDHKAIRGNGQPGLIERVTTLESQAAPDIPRRVTKLESQAETATWGIRAFFAVVGFIVSKMIDVIAQNWR